MPAPALDVLADAAVDEALEVVARVADDGELGLTTEVTTLEAARYCLKRINDVRMDEWLDEVEVWVWDAHTSVRRPITPAAKRTASNYGSNPASAERRLRRCSRVRRAPRAPA